MSRAPTVTLGDYAEDRSLTYRATERIAEELQRLRPDVVITWGAGTSQGFARLTTNRIAERAGVNIASLYQYFPGKDATGACTAENWRQALHRVDVRSPTRYWNVAKVAEVNS
jgi:hypothetical protein